MAVKELNDWKNEEVKIQFTVDSLVKNEEIRERQVSDMKAKIEKLKTDCEYLAKELERTKQTSAMKISQVTELTTKKINVLENESAKQKSSYEENSKKAFEVVKKQEIWNNKWKEEFGSMVSYYEKKLRVLEHDNEQLRRYLQNAEDY